MQTVSQERSSQNAFTLNNLGAAKEMEGENDEALKYYDQASSWPPNATAVVTTDRGWRGKPVSQMAKQNAKALRDHLSHETMWRSRWRS